MPVSNYHISCPDGSMGGYCLLPGDPGRVEKIAAFLDNPNPVAQNREYTSWAGSLGGVTVSVCSTGIGGPSAAIAVEELHAIGVHTFIRIGTAGGIAIPVMAGDLVIANSAVRFEGTSLHYAPIEYPATSDFDVTTVLVNAADALKHRRHVGVVQCKDSFYGQHTPERSPVSRELLEKWEIWKRLGVLASEMETAALFTVAASLGARAGAVMNIVWNKEREAAGLDDGDEAFDMTPAIECAVEALKLLIKADAAQI